MNSIQLDLLYFYFLLFFFSITRNFPLSNKWLPATQIYLQKEYNTINYYVIIGGKNYSCFNFIFHCSIYQMILFTSEIIQFGLYCCLLFASRRGGVGVGVSYEIKVGRVAFNLDMFSKLVFKGINNETSLFFLLKCELKF